MPQVELFISANKHITGFMIANTIDVTKSSSVGMQYISCHSYAEMSVCFHCLDTDLLLSAIVEVIFIFLINFKMMLRKPERG